MKKYFTVLLMLSLSFAALTNNFAQQKNNPTEKKSIAFRDRLLPAPVNGGFKMKDYWIWCGSVIKGEDGKYHMFASRWPKTLSFTPHWVTNSEVVRAVSDNPEGPYTFQEVVLPPRGEQYWDGKMTHNPTIHKSGDTYLLFYTGTTYKGNMPSPEHPAVEEDPLEAYAHRHERIGLATSKSVYGPWTRLDKPILDVRPGKWDSLLVSNAAPIVLQDGKIYLFYKGVSQMRHHAISVAVADSYDKPFKRITDEPFNLGVDAEDPTIWFENGKYHILMLDTSQKYSSKGIYYGTSNDLLHWEADPNPVAISRNILFDDGIIRRMTNTERPQILVQNGIATHIFFATGSNENGSRSTWNMVIPLKPESEIKDRMQWWRDARFGMFIHWGLYSIHAGMWKGRPITHENYINPYAEHIMWINKIPIKEYSKLAEEFNPTNFNAEEIVRQAKNSGMKYIVITAKHHDGFAMFKSDVNKYNIVDATPYKKDPLKALSDACIKEGIKFCFYYSLGRDWHNADAISLKGNNWDFTDSTKRNYQRYIDETVKPQLKELLTNYGQVGVVWFDTPEQTTLKQSIDLELYVKSIQPECIVNTRIGNKIGDYEEMSDNKIPSTGINKDWETPGTMAESWGYSLLDTKEYWKSPKELIHKLIDIVSKGGNYLLNIGPDGKGNIPPQSLERLAAISEWMKVNGESIYETTASKFSAPDWGRFTTKDKITYAHIFNWPLERSLLIHMPAKNILKVELLTKDGMKELKLKKTYGSGTIIYLPSKAPDKYVSVIKITEK